MIIGTTSSTRFDDLLFDREGIKTLACELDRRTPLLSNNVTIAFTNDTFVRIFYQYYMRTV